LRFSSHHRPHQRQRVVHPSVGFSPPSASSAVCPPPQCAHLSGSFHEVSCLFARSTSRVRCRNGFHAAAAFRPWVFSTLRRFTPQHISWACFIPLARPGFALQGLSLAWSGSGSSPHPALLRLPPTRLTVSSAIRLRLRFRAFIPLRVRCADSTVKRLRRPIPSWAFPSSGLAFSRPGRPFRDDSPLEFSRRHVRDVRSQLLRVLPCR
jgi:hypothetical protein